MTTGAMVLGSVPLAIATGAGAEARNQIGWVIVGGMAIGTFFTLFVVPVVYLFIGAIAMRLRCAGANRVQHDPLIAFGGPAGHSAGSSTLTGPASRASFTRGVGPSLSISYRRFAMRRCTSRPP